jgi:hypothetical protein
MLKICRPYDAIEGLGHYVTSHLFVQLPKNLSKNSTAGDHSLDILLVRSVRAIILIVFIVGPFIGLWNV